MSISDITSFFSSFGVNDWFRIAYAAIIGVCVAIILIYRGNIKELEGKIVQLEASKVVLKTAIEQQNEDIAKYKADLKKYNTAVVDKVTVIKEETKKTTESVKQELKKDNSDTNKVKVIDGLLMDFSDGK